MALHNTAKGTTSKLNAVKGAGNKLGKNLKGLPKGSLMTFATTVGFETLAGTTEGRGLGTALTRGVGMGFVEAAIGPWAYSALWMASSVPSMAQGYMGWEDRLRSQQRSRRDPGNMNFSYTDTEAAYTMRQSAVQAIQGSKLNARSALGGEAKLMHRGIPR